MKLLPRIMSSRKENYKYQALARNEARFRLKENLLEQMLLSVDDLDDFHESFMIKLQRDNFNNILSPSDVQEIKQAVQRRKQQWRQLEKVFHDHLQTIPPESMNYIPFQEVYNHVRSRKKRQINQVIQKYNETHSRELIDQLWTKAWSQVPKVQ